MKIVLNKCFGGFGLSKKAYDFLGLEWDGYGFCFNSYEERTDEKLIECVEKLGEDADGRFASLAVVEIPDGIDYEITEYDGIETVEETHRSW